MWGAGGKRMSAEQIALQRRLAAQQMAQGADYSPVTHWMQGAARLANGLAGTLQMRRADKAQDARSGELNNIAKLLVEGSRMPDGSDPVAAALAFPELQGLAEQAMKQRTHEAPAPTEFARLIAERDALPRGSPQRAEFDKYIQSKGDQFITANLPTGFYAGPQSGFAAAMQGGVPTAPVGKLTPIEPTVQNTPAPELGANGMPAALTRQQYNAVVAAKGRAATDDWARRNNITVRD
jgi:hypothetical protein